ncbi:MAG: hypothetical protein WC748_01000 [Legionellales bacterium]|jgi:hypothetical protein
MKKILITHKAAIGYAILIGLITLLPRLTGGFSVDQYLWAEDGNIFINQASMGMSALWEPYAGYLHLYPRIIAWISMGLPINAVPTLFFAGWLFIFIIMVILIMNRSLETGIGFWGGLILIAVISLQPHLGEMFFTITNAQWMIGVALSLYLLVDSDEKFSYLKMFALAIACLTGPFSAILLPVLFLKGLIFKDFKKKSAIYLIVLTCALVQILVFLIVGRPSSQGLDPNLLNWIKTAGIFLFFGGGQWLICIIILSLTFWSTAAYILFRSFRTSNEAMVRDRTMSLLLVFAALLVFLAAIFANRHAPAVLSPIGGAARYYIIPYALIFFAMALVARHFTYERILLIGSLSIICILQMGSIERPSLYFYAFTEFARYKENLMIPINPSQPTYPGWLINGNLVAPAKIPIKPITLYELPSPSIETNWCPNSQYIGLEINMTQDQNGWVQAFWSANNNFSQKNSLQRYYPEGLIDAHFAFPNNDGPLFFRLDTSAQINSIDIYCLGASL